ncbi:LuxR C-terminal-related transcriptional regulator [Corynebacterium anserum]|uniref:LuxR C-terminal-related transcriptional regulator n=1 Tax=Corynebacterium anserum TaxID=2684406 RepID=UPI001641DE87|nr:LuxR C-terminal-related transcriptional regulator [Corynebacterium anserum]
MHTAIAHHTQHPPNTEPKASLPITLDARTVLTHPQLNGTLSLSAEQEKIVVCIQKGMTNRQIAAEMNYAEITVKKKYHIY